MQTETMFNGMFGKVAPGLCKLSMDGKIAVKTDSGYKAYNLKTKRLTNCSNFVFAVGDEFFFVIPTNKVEPGDIILQNNKPKCVISKDKTTITVINYDTAVVETILPERHVFMGNTYFYGKIVSMFGADLTSGKKGMNNMMKYMMMSEIMKGNSGNDMMSTMMMMSMMNGGGMDSMFDGLFDPEDEDVPAVEDSEEEEEE